MVMIICLFLSRWILLPRWAVLSLWRHGGAYTTTTALAIKRLLVGNRGYRHGGYHGVRFPWRQWFFMAVAGTAAATVEDTIRATVIRDGHGKKITVDPSHAYLERLPHPLSIFQPQKHRSHRGDQYSNSVGNTLMHNLDIGQYPGKLFPVNPSTRACFDRKCFQCDSDEDPVDSRSNHHHPAKPF